VEPSNSFPDDTRERLIDAALRQFADSGFHAASIASIAGELGLTKQALLYYFKRKEDLYREVMRRISIRLREGMRSAIDPDDPPARQFVDMVLGIYDTACENPADTRVLMRELLENERKDAPPEEWYLKGFLDAVIERLDAIDGLKEQLFARKFASVYQIISAIEYFAASGKVLRRFYGDEEFARIKAAYPDELRAQVRRLIESGSAG